MEPFDPEIVALCCNWCGYAGADLAGVSRIQYPTNIKIVRVMCSGRIEASHILVPLQLGADGVMVVCCHPGDCHYISGNERAKEIFEMTRPILRSLGLKDRFRVEYVSAAEGAKFGQVVSDFVKALREMGPNPMKEARHKFSTGDGGLPYAELVERVNEILLTTGANKCLECGKCAASCPVTRMRPEYSPMLTVERALRELDNEIAEDMGLWTCMTCGACSFRCPSGVDYPGFIRRVRELHTGVRGTCSHGGLFTAISKIMSWDHIHPQDRLDWVSDGLKVARRGKVLYFVGCLPFFDPVLRDNGTPYTEIARSTVKVLNRAGITPVVLEDERCCGHDLLWSGEGQEGFADLARLNVEAIKATGAETVVMSCPECLRTFQRDYPEHIDGGTMDFKLLHTSQLFADLIEEGKLKLDGEAAEQMVVTYQDPCRLGRHLGIFDPPRSVLNSLPGIELREMATNRGNAICCGTSSWLNCGTYSKRIQMDRMKEAAATTAGTMITACPKCLIHFNCTLTEPPDPEAPPKPDIEIKDLSVLLAEVLDGTEGDR